MVKVAIATWFHYHNYGTALQAVALRKALRDIGYEADTVNYLPHGRRTSNAPSTDWSDLERVVDDSRSEKFKLFIKNNLSLTTTCSRDRDFLQISNSYDLFVAGSDQVWSPVVFDERYYFDYVQDNRRKIAYAPSMGVESVEDGVIKEKMTQYISRFAHIGTREAAGGRLVKELTGREATMVVDPTLLLSRSEWHQIISTMNKAKSSKKNDEKYILCYFLGDNAKARAHAREIAKQKQLPIKVVPVFAKDEELGALQSGVGPVEYFELIEGAEVVLTDSYHGVIFSIICEKPFFAFERFHPKDPISQNARVYEVLSLVGAEANLIGFDDELWAEYSAEYDTRRAQENIKDARSKSIGYLRDSLQISSPKVSIIVPMYNVEDYVVQCLESILRQTYSNIEVIAVDDGSPDKSGKLADGFAAKDGRVTVIHTANKGLSSARNTGYDASNGEYVVFVDSDDALAPDYVEYMVGLIQNTDTNFAMSLNRFDVLHQEQEPNDAFENVEPVTVLKNIEYSIWPQEVWNKIYKKSFLDKHDIRHTTKILYGEGNTFNHHVLRHSGDVGVGRRRVYYYRYNPQSSTRKFVWGERMQSFKYAIEERQRVVNDMSREIKVAYQYHKWNAGLHLLRGLISVNGDKEYPAEYKWWRRTMRRNVIGAVIADGSVVPSEVKWIAIKSYFLPKITAASFADGFEWEKAQADAFEKLAKADFNRMPWDRPSSMHSKTPRQDDPNSLYARRLNQENATLRAELASHMSIKRSLRLLLGNIKRRIKYGKDR